MLNTFVAINVEMMACAKLGLPMTSFCLLHKFYSMITTTTNAAT